MASMIPLVAAPPAAAAAARPSRAARPTGDAVADTFDQALARSAADSAPSATPASSPATASPVPSEEPAFAVETAPSGPDTWVAAWIAFAPQLEAPPARPRELEPSTRAHASEAVELEPSTRADASEAVELEPSTRADASEPVDVVKPSADVERTVASPLPPATGVAAGVPVVELLVERVDAGTEVAGESNSTLGASLELPAPSAPQTRQTAPRAVARSQQPDSVEPASGDAKVSVPVIAMAIEAREATPSQSLALESPAATTTPSPASDAAPEAARPAPATTRASDNPMRIAARQVLRDALAESPGFDRTAVTIAAPRADAVATPALVVTLPVPTAPSVQRQVAASEQSVEDAHAEWPEVAPPPAAVTELTEPTGRRTGGERSGQGQDPQPQAFWSRSAGQAAPTILPASMVFPGQATFASALEHAAPLTTGLPPSFAPQVLTPVVPQVVKGLQVQIAAGGGDMTLTLAPEHLGTVTIEVKVDQQRVQATLTSDTPAVRGWIAAHEQDLKSGLAELGLHLDELVVREDGRQQGDRRDQPSPERRRKQPTDEDAIFEVVV